MRKAVMIGLCVMVGGAFLFACSSGQKMADAGSGHPDYKELCSQCHKLDRVELAHESVSKDHMREIVARMAKKPGSRIGPNDFEALLNQMY